jgi:thiosulfate reductase cytochrome b subunit
MKKRKEIVRYTITNKHPLAIRWFHWLNFPLLAVMVWSGLLIYWANQAYRLGWGDTTLVKFFPKSFHEALGTKQRLGEGMSLHFVFMWAFAFNGLLYALYLWFSKEWKLLLPNRRSFAESWMVILHDLHIRKSTPPHVKYNAAQRIAYSMVIVMGFLMLLTGIAIYKPVQFHRLVYVLGGYEWARAEHFIITLLFCLFFIVHIVQVILAGWNNFLAMIRGFEVVKGSKKIISEHQTNTIDSEQHER